MSFDAKINQKILTSNPTLLQLSGGDPNYLFRAIAFEKESRFRDVFY